MTPSPGSLKLTCKAQHVESSRNRLIAWTATGTGAVRSHRGAAVLWAFALLAAITLSTAAATKSRMPGDLSAARNVQAWSFPGEPLANLVRALTSTEVVLGLGVAFVIAAWVGDWRRPALVLAVGLVLLVLLQTGLKELVDRPRPGTDLIDIRASFQSESFPSGHVLSGTYLYGFLAWAGVGASLPTAARATIPGLALLFLALSGLANIYLGGHWPSDVIGGYLWAFVLLIPAAGYAFPRVPTQG